MPIASWVLPGNTRKWRGCFGVVYPLLSAFEMLHLCFLCVVSYAFFPQEGIKSALAWDTVSPVMGMSGLGQFGPVSSSTTDTV